jgi:hypothetical protein
VVRNLASSIAADSVSRQFLVSTETASVSGTSCLASGSITIGGTGCPKAKALALIWFTSANAFTSLSVSWRPRSRISPLAAAVPLPSTASPITTSTLRLGASFSSSATPSLSPATSDRAALGPAGPGVGWNVARSARGLPASATAAPSA